jgi:AP-3 complex subunit mu
VFHEDLTLSFSNPNLLECVQLHRCVRIHRFQRDKIVSFVPPDGKFTLLRFRIPGSGSLPIVVTPQIELKAGKCMVKVTVTCGPGVKSIERLALEVRFPRRTMAFNLSCNIGKLVPDEITKLLQWNIGKLTDKKSAELEGHVVLPRDFDDDTKAVIKALFEIKNFSSTGLRIESLSIHNAKYI